jgi:hypothetical protein
MENGKETAEIGLILRALQVLGLRVELREPRVERTDANEKEEYRMRAGTIIGRSIQGDTVHELGGGRPTLTRGGKSLSASRGGRKPPRRLS